MEGGFPPVIPGGGIQFDVPNVGGSLQTLTSAGTILEDDTATVELLAATVSLILDAVGQLRLNAGAAGLLRLETGVAGLVDIVAGALGAVTAEVGGQGRIDIHRTAVLDEADVLIEGEGLKPIRIRTNDGTGFSGSGLTIDHAGLILLRAVAGLIHIRSESTIISDGSDALNDGPGIRVTDPNVAGGGIHVDETGAWGIGFFGATPTSRPVVPGAPTAQDVVDALVTLGLVSQ